MASGIITLTRTGSGYLQGQIVWSSVSNGAAANSSNLTAELQIRRSAQNTTTGTFKGTFTVGSVSETISWYGSLPSMEWITIKTITETVGHNADGNGSCYLYAIVNGPGMTTMEGTYVSGAATVSPDWIPRYASVISVADFTDEGNPVLTYSNPAGEAVDALQACISLDGATEFVPYTDIPKTGTSYTFALTEENRNTLRAAAAKSKTLPIHFFIRSTIGGSTSYENKTATMSIVNAAPTISPVVVDTNSATIALTGDSSILVALHSSADVTFNAAAQKYATIVSTRAENGTNVLTSDGKISQIQNAPLVFTISDSRGNTTTQNAANRIIPYFNPTCSIGRNMPEGNGSFDLTVTGRFYNGSFGAETNGLTVQYRYKAAGGSYPNDWMTFPEATKNGNDYTAQAYLTGLDYQTTYTFQARVIDSIHTGGVYSAEVSVIAEPVFDWGKDDFRFRVPVRLASVYRSEQYSAYSNEQIIAAMQDAYERTADRSWGFFTLQIEISGLQLHGGVWHMTVFRTDAEYGAIEFVSYRGDGVDKRFASYIGGTFGAITENFAPAGYGLGGAVKIEYSKIDTTSEPGWYCFNHTGSIGGVSANFWYVFVVAHIDSSFCTQHLYSCTPFHHELVRHKQEGTWQEWECINPPMIAGVEHPTIERWNGKPVYCVALTGTSLEGQNFAYLPKEITAGELVSVTGQVGDYPVPTTMGSSLLRYHNWVHDSVGFTCDAPYVGYPYRFVVKYTK